MNKRIMPLLAAILALMVVLTACGSTANKDSGITTMPQSPGSSNESNSFPGFAGDMVMPEEGETDASESTAGSVTDGRKLVKTVRLELESKKYEDALASLQKLIEEAGGYIESQNEQGVSYYDTSSYYSRYATLTARIPAERLEEVVEAAGGLCNLVNKSSDIADITDSYTDTEARLETLKLQEERLLSILAKATTLSDVIELEQSLSGVRYQIESLTAQLKSMDGQVSYSTLQLTLSEVVEYNLVTNPPETLGERLGDAWQNALTIVKNGFSGFMVWLVTYLPSIVIWAVILGSVGALALHFIRRGRAKKKAALPAKTAPVEETPEEKQE